MKNTEGKGKQKGKKREDGERKKVIFSIKNEEVETRERKGAREREREGGREGGRG